MILLLNGVLDVLENKTVNHPSASNGHNSAPRTSVQDKLLF